MRIGIITSGGDAPGMNAAIRAITRCAIDKGMEVIGIHEGWQGVVDGSEQFQPLTSATSVASRNWAVPSRYSPLEVFRSKEAVARLWAIWSTQA